MDRNAVEAMCQIAQTLTAIRGMVSMGDKNIYRMVREQIGDCLETMGKYCDAAPVSIIGGDVEGIMENHEHMKRLQETA